MNSQAVIATVLCLLAAGAVSAQTGKKTNRSYLGQVMPDINAEGATWINAPRGVSLKELRGGPTLVCYTFLG